ncbi:hypothetical protein [Bradyrhizobium sp. McL0616]|uniref:hypothetical protein n=1 Tax=Bradyrhizobium sp. McL0616 TaxID=3415674 RepID=UPI003CF1136C
MSNVIELPTRTARRPAMPPSNVAEVKVVPYSVTSVEMLDPRRPPELQTETGKNAKLRLQRREAWWQAERQVEYWKACMKMHHAISNVQRAGMPEGDNHQEAEHWHWHPIAENYRKAVARLFLTPASTQLNIAWKKKALAAKEHNYTELTDKQIERAIQRDLEFLAAHPTRRKREDRRHEAPPQSAQEARPAAPDDASPAVETGPVGTRDSYTALKSCSGPQPFGVQHRLTVRAPAWAVFFIE